MQNDLFNYKPPEKYPLSPGFKEPTTSKDAATKMKVRAPKLQARVLTAIGISRHGLTPDECAKLLKTSILSVRPRFSELSKLEKIERSGARRANESGLKADVWIIKKDRPNEQV